jgi:hypothetical protein
MKLLFSVSVQNLKEIDVLAFLLLRESRISLDTKNLMLANNSKFYNVFESSNYDNDGQYTILASNVNNFECKEYTISEYIKL